MNILRRRSSRQAQPASRRKPARHALCAACLAAVGGAADAADDLTSLSLEQLLEVKIVGASKYEQAQNEVAAAVSVITRQEIKVFGWRTLDEALTSLPGVHLSYDRQYTYLGVRGFGLPQDYNTRLLVTINGNRVNDPAYDVGPGGRQFPLDIGLVERIEFIPGPGGAVYGQNAMFGVVNVITRDGSDVDGTELAAGAYSALRLGEARASWGRRLDNGVDILLSASAMHSQGEDRFFEYGSSGISGVAAGLDGERDQEFFAHLARGPWSFDFVYGNRRKDDPTATYLSDPLVPGQFQADRYQLANLQYQDNFAGNTLNLLGRVFFGREYYSSILSYGTPVSFPAESEWRGFELRLLSTRWADHKLMLGLEAQDNVRLDQDVIYPDDPAASVLIPGSGYRVGLYVQDEWRVTDTFSATLGLRVDRNNATGTQSSPRAAAIWQASPATTLKALYGRAHRAPNVGERDYDDGVAQVANKSLEGETVDTLELVADHRIGRDLLLRASAFQWKMRNLIVLGIDPISGLSQFQSGDPVNARGLELSLDKTWPQGARLRASLAFQDAAYQDGAELLNSPRQLAKINLSAPLGVAGLHLGWQTLADSRRLSLSGGKLGGWAVSNLNLSTDRLAKGLEASLGVVNLFDKRYAHPASDINWQNELEQDGRSVRLQFLVRF